MTAGGLIVPVLWTLLLARKVMLARATPFLAPDDGLPEAPPRVDAIIPAHNEERDVEATVRAVRSQNYPHLNITVVDDRSTDGTGAILRRLADELPGIRVIDGVPRPPGWVGKTWAIQQAHAGLSAEWIWFVDADMGLDPRALSTAMARARRVDADLVSIIARPVVHSFWQGAVALCIGEILYQLYPLSRANDPSRSTAIAAGGFILVKRSRYEQIGGHEALRGEIVEDIALSRRIKAAGGRLSTHLAPGLVWTHMYGTIREIWVGLRKNAYAGMDYRFHKFVALAIGGLILAWGPHFELIRGLATGDRLRAAAGLWGLLAETLTMWPSLVFLGIPWWYALTFPFGLTAYIAIAASGVWHHHRGRILWKDVVMSPADILSTTGGR